MPSQEDRKRVAGRLLLLPMAGWAVMAGGGYYPTRSLAGSEGVRAMLLAQLLVMIVVLATLLPAMSKMVGRSPAEAFKIAMLTGMARFLATGLLLAAIAWRGRVHVAAFVLWGAAAYVLMVVLEAVILARWSAYFESKK